MSLYRPLQPEICIENFFILEKKYRSFQSKYFFQFLAFPLMRQSVSDEAYPKTRSQCYCLLLRFVFKRLHPLVMICRQIFNLCIIKALGINKTDESQLNLIKKRQFQKTYFGQQIILFLMGSAPSREFEQDYLDPMNAYRPLKQLQEANVNLKIAFLNYGVCTSPFQYQVQDQKGDTASFIVELQQIFKNEFRIVTGEQFDLTYNWNIGQLDKYLKKFRYSPLYYDDVGVIHNKFFITKEQFEQKWIHAFDIAISNFLTQQQINSEVIKEQKKNLLKMDWTYFRTFVVFSYKSDNLTFDEIIAKRTATNYLNFMSDKFQSKVINQKYKIEKLLKRLKLFEVDILFLQDIDSKFIRYIEKKTSSFRIVQCKRAKSAILISWKAIRKIVGDSIRPFDHYNKKYLDPNQNYEISPETAENVFQEKAYENHHFEQKPNRNFQLAAKKISAVLKLKLKKSSTQGKKESNPQNVQPTSENKAKTEGPAEKQSEDMVDSRVVEEPSTYLSPKLFDNLIWNDTTIVQFIGNIVLITSYLDFEDHPQQQKWMYDSLNQLKKSFPKLTVIAAVYAYKDIEDILGYNIYPNVREQRNPTVYKKKTTLQPKIKKAKKLIQLTQDYFISTVPLNDACVIDINHNGIGENPRLIPSEQHPYDHYIISANVNCTVTRKVKKMN